MSLYKQLLTQRHSQLLKNAQSQGCVKMNEEGSVYVFSVFQLQFQLQLQSLNFNFKQVHIITFLDSKFKFTIKTKIYNNVS